jgi:hypothetical protein
VHGVFRLLQPDIDETEQQPQCLAAPTRRT